MTTGNNSAGFNLADLFVDNERSEKGVWVDYYSGAQLLLASLDSIGYKSELARLARANKLILDEHNPDQFEAIRKITCEALAKKVLLDWRNIHLPNEQGEIQRNVKYTWQIGMQCLLRSEVFKDFVTGEADKLDNYREEVVKAAKKPPAGL